MFSPQICYRYIRPRTGKTEIRTSRCPKHCPSDHLHRCLTANIRSYPDEPDPTPLYLCNPHRLCAMTCEPRHCTAPPPIGLCRLPPCPCPCRPLHQLLADRTHLHLGCAKRWSISNGKKKGLRPDAEDEDTSPAWNCACCAGQYFSSISLEMVKSWFFDANYGAKINTFVFSTSLETSVCSS